MADLGIVDGEHASGVLRATQSGHALGVHGELLADQLAQQAPGVLDRARRGELWLCLDRPERALGVLGHPGQQGVADLAIGPVALGLLTRAGVVEVEALLEPARRLAIL